jgi:hypothetical protein
MRRTHRLVSFAVTAAFALAPVFANAQKPEAQAVNSQSGQTVQQSSQDGQQLDSASQANLIQVREHFVRNVADHCQFVANVRGTLQPVGGRPIGGGVPQPGMVPQPLQTQSFIPDLSVDVDVVCPNSQGEHLTVRTLAGQPLTQSQLLQALSDRASVVAVSGGRICTFTPTFTLRNNILQGQSVGQQCERPSVGGGPIEDSEYQD